jgi:hypothetical protein
MDAFLKEAAKHGTKDSRGVFTINAEKAEIKLAKYQLAGLAQFPMFLLAAGTAAGVSRFEVSFHGKKTRIRYEGWTLTSTDLHSIGMQALKKETSRPLRFLGIAFSTIGSRFDFSIRSGDLEVAFVNMVMQFPETLKNADQFSGLEIEIESRLESEFDEGLKGQQKFCPFPVIIGRKELLGGYDPSLESLDSYAYMHRPGQGLYAVNLNYADSVVLELPEEEDKIPLLVSFTHPNEGDLLGFWILVNGLACRAPAGFAPAGFYGVAAGDNLELSLSHEIVNNASYQEFRLQVCEACLELCYYTQAQLAGSKNRIQVRLLEDALQSVKPHLPVSRRIAVENAHAQAYLQSPGQVEDTLGPVIDPKGLESLLPLLADLDEMRLDVLLTGYKKRCRQSKEAGRYREMLVWHQTLLKIKQTLKKDTETDSLVHYLLEIIQNIGELPSPETLHNFSLSSPENRLTISYLSCLASWANGEDVRGHTPAVHPTWLYPLALDCQAESTWTRLLDLITEEKISEALVLVKTHPPLFYRGNEHQWLQYFWTHHRGQLSWVVTIALRVELSFCEQAPAEGYGTLPLLDDARLIIANEISRPPFWPNFLTLLQRARRSHSETDRRRCWSALFLDGLATGYLTSNKKHPLLEPFSPGQW